MHDDDKRSSGAWRNGNIMQALREEADDLGMTNAEAGQYIEDELNARERAEPEEE